MTLQMQAIAEDLPASAWKPLERTIRQPVGPPREKRRNVKREIIRRRGYTHLELQSEDVAEFTYRPVACERDYRMVVVRKNISKEKGEARLIDEIQYFFSISNDHRRKHEAERDQILKMEFRTFLDQFISIPCQILGHGGRVIYRLLGYRDLTPAFFRLCGRLNL